jgi:hypothetical protein
MISRFFRTPSSRQGKMETKTSHQNAIMVNRASRPVGAQMKQVGEWAA